MVIIFDKVYNFVDGLKEYFLDDEEIARALSLCKCENCRDTKKVTWLKVLQPDGDSRAVDNLVKAVLCPREEEFDLSLYEICEVELSLSEVLVKLLDALQAYLPHLCESEWLS